jgi:hypothetical protein
MHDGHAFADIPFKPLVEEVFRHFQIMLNVRPAIGEPGKHLDGFKYFHVVFCCDVSGYDTGRLFDRTSSYDRITISQEIIALKCSRWNI